MGGLRIHKVDQARYVTGGGDWSDVQAMGAWFGETSRMPTHITTMGRLGEDIIFSLNTSFTYTAFIEPRHRAEYLDIVGTEGVIQQTGEDLKLVSASLTTDMPPKEKGKGSIIAAMLDELAEAVAHDQPLPEHTPTGEDGLAAQRFVEQANHDALAHRPVTRA